MFGRALLPYLRPLDHAGHDLGCQSRGIHVAADLCLDRSHVLLERLRSELRRRHLQRFRMRLVLRMSWRREGGGGRGYNDIEYSMAYQEPVRIEHCSYAQLSYCTAPTICVYLDRLDTTRLDAPRQA